MEYPRHIKQAITSLLASVWDDEISEEDAKNISTNLDTLLASENVLVILKQRPDIFEPVLCLFIRSIFSANPNIAGPCLKHCDAILEVFRAQSPKKLSPSYKKFEQNTLLNFIGSLKPRVEANDKYWAALWMFSCNLLTSHSVMISSLNKLLNITEAAYKNKNSKHRNEIIENAWLCWKCLIDAFGRNPRILTPEKAIGLLIKPLLTLTYSSETNIDTWVHLIEVKGLSGSGDIMKSIVKPMLVRMYESGEKSMCRQSPDGCAKAIIKILAYNHVIEHCMTLVIEVFGQCVNSRPSTSVVEQLALVLVKSINAVKDDRESYRLWKTLLEQFNSCNESPIMSQACINIFSDVNFVRWLDSGIIEGKDIMELMTRAEFREKVLLRSIRALSFDEPADTPSKKKSRKGSYENMWSSICEAYISRWENLSPPSPKDNGKPEATQPMIDSSDYQAVQLLLLQPIQLNIWNPTVYKTWTRLCEACHNHKFLHTSVRAIFESTSEHFNVRQVIDVLDTLYKLDGSFCKHSKNVFENLLAVIPTMEFQSLLGVLNLSKVAVNYPDMNQILSKLCKFANEKVSDYDQLNGHKIRTKVSKITRKLEQNSHSAEKDETVKSQRVPFRSQSNFLHRLAKANEKNRSKRPILSSMLSSSVKLENDEEGLQPVINLNGPTKNGVEEDQENGIDDIKPIGIVEDSTKVSTELFKKSPSHNLSEDSIGNDSILLPAVNCVTTMVSPKMKITNAREVRTVDSFSPVNPKKSKPLAGLKTTPKKLTPSKVSYFDDDANDFVMVPPKPKTTPLTEHQMEMMSKRRTDIPALYQDLSQDTQQSQKAEPISEVTTGVSPKIVQESQEIVPGTPSPAERAGDQSPERKSSTSAKKLDFTNLSTPPSKASIVTGCSSTSDTLDKPEGGETCKPLEKSILLTESSKDDPVPLNGYSDVKTSACDAKEMDTSEFRQGTEERKKKRKSEPSKFSPKLTRSKKNLKSVTPDAKMLKLPAPDAQIFRTKSPLSFSKSSLSEADTPKIVFPDARVGQSDLSEPNDRTEAPVSALNVANVDEANTSELVESTVLRDLSKDLNKRVSLQPSNEQSDDIANNLVEKASVVSMTSGSDETIPCRSPIDDILPSSQSQPDAQSLSQEKSKKARKRKIVESSHNDTSKKSKPSSLDDASCSCKKIDSTKKKKPFKLGVNLESWLLKTERSPTAILESTIKSETIETCNSVMVDSAKPELVSLPTETVVELDDSQEIVPSTQETENGPPVLPVLEVKADNDTDKLIMDMKQDVEGLVSTDAGNSTPKKAEGVLERLKHESPNDEIDLVMSPSKRQRRAPSVFRGEGDTYLAKEMFYTTPPEEPEDDVKSARGKKSTLSQSSKKRLQLGGRSAKMLRLATSSCTQEDIDEIPVTPSRRRESIAPVRYGENWPKGPTEEWIACTPQSPYMSPYRSVLKKTPGLEDTPMKNRSDLASPLSSSGKIKRVMFLDPPVTRGLLYDLDSPGGSIHHADIPPGTPYPTWKDEDNPKMDASPCKRDAERLNALADLKSEEETSPKRRRCSKKDPPSAFPLVSEEVRQLIDPEPIVPNPEPDISELKAKFQLSDSLMSTLSETEPHIRSLLVQCFDCADMKSTVGSWKFEDCIRVNHMPVSFLLSVRNSKGEVITDVLSSFHSPPMSSECFTQTEQVLAEKCSQTLPPPIAKDSQSQTNIIKHRTVETCTIMNTTSSSTQADLRLPVADELPEILNEMTTQQCFTFLKNMASICEKKSSK